MCPPPQRIVTFYGTWSQPSIIGQLKWMATNAYNEFEEKLPGGAGANVQTLVEGFSESNNNNPVRSYLELTKFYLDLLDCPNTMPDSLELKRLGSSGRSLSG